MLIQLSLVYLFTCSLKSSENQTKYVLLFNVLYNLLVILLVDFHVHFWLLLVKRAHLKGSSEKKSTSTENFGGGEADAPSACAFTCNSKELLTSITVNLFAQHIKIRSSRPEVFLGMF